MSSAPSAELAALRNRHSGETLWVIAAGPTLNFIDPSFFADKITVAVSHGAITHGIVPDFVFSNHWSQMVGLVEKMPKTMFVLNDKEWPSLRKFPDRRHSNVALNKVSEPPMFGANFSPWLAEPNPFGHIIFGTSSLHGAMHLSAFLGAGTIILVGADNSRLDGKWSLDGHPTRGYPIVDYEFHLRMVKNWLIDTFGVNTYSLNPFVNLHLEGHHLNDRPGRFTGMNRLLGKASYSMRKILYRKVVASEYW